MSKKTYRGGIGKNETGLLGCGASAFRHCLSNLVAPFVFFIPKRVTDGCFAKFSILFPFLCSGLFQTY